MNWLYLVIVIALAVSCNQPKQEDKPPGPGLVATGDTLTVISLAQLVLDTIFDDPKLAEELGSGTLKKLWDYDKQLYIASNDNTNATKRFIVSRKVNPCCPCSSTDPMCCMCLVETDFAAVSDMEATATLNDANMAVTSTITGVDLFSVPSGTADGTYDLKISGKSIREVKYSVEIQDGKMKF